VQNYYRDSAGRLCWRTDEDGGLPPSSVAIVSPYDTTARYVRHGHTDTRNTPGSAVGAGFVIRAGEHVIRAAMA